MIESLKEKFFENNLKHGKIHAMTSEDNMEKKRYYNIDFLRIFFVVLIVYYHFMKANYVTNWHIPFFENLTKNVAWAGSVGNATLFIVSGFFLYASFLKYQEPFLKFAIRKLIRFWPVLCFAIILAALLGAFGLTLCNFKHFDIGQGILNLFAITKGTGLTTKLSNTYASWFVCNLFWTSIFYYALFKITNNKFKYNFIVAIITFFGFILYVNSTLRDIEVIYGVMPKSLILALSHIGLGILIYNLIDNINLKQIKFNKILFTIFELSLSFYLVHGCIIKKFKENYFVLILATSFLFILFIINQGYLSRLLNNKIFSKIGKYAFSIYIMQDIVFVFFRNYLWKQEYLVLNFPILTIIISLLSAVLLGVLTYHLIEEPCAKFLKKKLLDNYDSYIKISGGG